MRPPPIASPRPAASATEAQETIEAIHQGEVDAVIVQGPEGPQVVMLHGAEEPYRALVERMSDGALVRDLDGTILYANARLSYLTGERSESLIGTNTDKLFVRTSSNAGAAGECALKRGDETVPISVWQSPIEIGGVAAMLVVITDLSLQVQAKEALTAERFARSILEQATEAIVVLAPDGRITHASGVAEKTAGKSVVGCKFSDVFPIDVQSSPSAGSPVRFARGNLDTLLATRPFHGAEVKLRTPHLVERFYLLSAGPLLDEAKEPIGAIVTLTDITGRRRAEEQQTMLVAELNHRVKNILAVVQAVAGQTVRASPSLAAFKNTFNGRIKAISIAHDILTRTRWIGIGLSELLATVLAPYRSGDTMRVSIEGPPVLLPARSVVPLSMALHELATNASKYGALCSPQGKVDVGWRVEPSEPAVVELTWSESGGPHLSSETMPGFGTTLIERVIAHDLEGTARLTFLPGGAVAVITFPLNRQPDANDLAGAASDISNS